MTASGFTESGFERKLAELNSSQQSILALSSWLIHHRKHCSTIVKVWYKEFLKAQEHRKLTFIYLANDVIQNGRKKGTEFLKTFAPIFKKSFEYMARIPGDKVKKSVLRILGIWAERGIYEAKLIKDFEEIYLKVWEDLHGGDEDEYDPANNDFDVDFESFKGQVTTPPGSGPSSEAKSASAEKKDEPDKNDNESKSKEIKVTPTKKTESPSLSSTKKSENSTRSSHERRKRKRTRKEEIESILRKRSLEATNVVEEWETDGVGTCEVKLSPSTYTEPPTEEELIKMIKDLERMPSTDGVTRNKIANLPQEVSEVDRVDEICTDSDIARSLQAKVKSALELLYDYNMKLDKESDDRKNASMRFQDFLYAQKDLLTQAEHRLEEHQSHVKVLTKKLEELKGHVLSMPDLTKLPSVFHGLDPLPSAGDLFNVLEASPLNENLE